MTALKYLLVLGLVITASGFASNILGDYVGPLEYKGYLVFDYPEGDNPIVNIVFTVDPMIAGNLIIVDVPAPWSYSYSGGVLTLSGGSLNPGGTVSVTVSLNKYFEEGEYIVNSVGTTSAGEVSNAVGPLLVGELYLLKIIDLTNTNKIPLVAFVAGLGFLEFWIQRRTRITDTGTSTVATTTGDCQDLVDKCKKARAAQKAAETEAETAKQNADSANKDYEKATKDVKNAEEKLVDAQKKPLDKDGAWVEIDGRRINSLDLKLRKDASKALWSQYRNGEIDAQDLEKAWEELGEHSALEELRKKSQEARKEAAEKDLENAKAQETGAKGKSEKAKTEAESAKKKAAEAKAHADKICKEADECLKALAAAPKTPTTVKDPPVPEEEPETTWTTEETMETTEPYDYTTETTEDYTTETTEETTRSTEDDKESPIPPMTGTTIFGPRLGETGLTPKTPEKPVVDPPSESDTSEEETQDPKCGPDVTQIYLKALNEIASRLRREYRRAPGGAWTDFWGARAAYGVTFLGANGWNMDFWVHSAGGCPSYPKCDRTVTLLGECVVAHTLNDLIYGLCAGFFGVPATIQNAGGHFAQLMAYGSLDPTVSQQIYKAGSELGESIRHRPVKIGIADLEVTVMRINAIKRKDCTPCLIPATDTFSDRDFSRKKWSWA